MLLSENPNPSNSQTSVFLVRNTIGIYVDFSNPKETDQETTSRKSQLIQNSDLFQEICHFDCGKGGIKTFVTAFGTGPFDGLFDIVGGKDSENYRNSRFKSHIGDPFGNFGSDIFKMGSASANDSAEADHSIKLLTGSKFLGQ